MRQSNPENNNPTAQEPILSCVPKERAQISESASARQGYFFSRPKGILFKTFLFTTVLITLVGVISFGILYAVLPGYYGYLKQRILNRNTDTLVVALESRTDSDEIKSRLSAFCRENNAIVTAFEADGNILPELSYPLIMLDETATTRYSVAITMQPDGELFIKSAPAQAGIAQAETAQIVGLTPTGDEQGQRRNFVFRQVMSATNIALVREISDGAIRRIEISSTLQPINEAQTVVVSLIPYLLVLDIVIALFAAYFYARRLTKPILLLSETASRMQQEVHGLQPMSDIMSNLGSDDELGLLSQNLDSLYERFCGALDTLKREMDKVSELERSKTDFMRAASHELKTPLAALNGITEGMIDGVGVYADTPRYLEESKKLIDRLAALVEEILNASKLEYLNEMVKTGADSQARNDQPFTADELTEMIGGLLEDYRFEIAEKNLVVEYIHTPDEGRLPDGGRLPDASHPLFVHRSGEKILRTALSNILSNAVRYTDHGGRVMVSLNATTITVENDCMRNESPGIPEDALARVFEPFYVLDYSRDRRKGGTGIGLFIVKRNLEALGIPYQLSNTETGVRFTLWVTPYPSIPDTLSTGSDSIIP